MFAQKNKVINISIISKTRPVKNCWCSDLYRVICLFLMVIFSISLFSDEFPVCFRLKPDSASDILKWERSLFSNEFSVERKVGNGKWDTVQVFERKVKVGVVLAGGVVRGVAHIGVLRALEENYIPIDGLSGTSMGSIIGGLYASGYSPDSLKWLVKEDIDWETFFQDQQPRMYTPIWERLQNKPKPPAMEAVLTLKPPFISLRTGTGIRIAQKFTDEIDDKTLRACYKASFDFSKLPHSFGAMIVNLNSGKPELKVKGTLSTALRASASIPVAFEPMIIEGEQYIDGGILDNLPVDAFLPDFDPLRKPDNIINIHDEEKGEALFVIASYPSKLRGSRDTATRAGEEMSGLIGIGVLNKSACLAREFHVWNNWDNADGQIDIDVKGGFDFNEEKLEELIDKGYYAAMMRIYDIKKELIRREDSFNPLGKNREIFEVGSVKLFHVKINDIKGNDTVAVKFKEAKKVEKAVKFIEGSYIEKNDVFYALKNIYNTGDYKNVVAKINKNKRKINIKFFLTKKDEYLKPVIIKLKTGEREIVCPEIEKKLQEYISGKRRKLNFSEIEKIVKNEYVNMGYVTPSVKKAEYSGNILTVHVDAGKKLNVVKIIIPNNSTESPQDSQQEKDSSEEESKREKDNSDLKAELEEEFKASLSPGKVLEKSKKVYVDYQLRTISVEGVKNDTLCIRVRPRTGHAFEGPALSFDKTQGINLFAELRTKRIRGLGNRSFYANFGKNYTVKVAKELPDGHSWSIGINRYSPFRLSIGTFFPDLSIGGRSLRYPSIQDTNLYDMKYVESFSGCASLPIYISNKSFLFIKDADFAIIPGIESCYKISLNGISEGDSLEPPTNLFLRFGYDELERGVFPSSGDKVSFESVYDWNRKSWKTKMKGTFVRGFRIQNKVRTVFTGEFYGSRCQEGIAFWERYSMGGITPVGSYQRRLYDFEDLPGYPRNKFLEPYMLKFVGSIRLTPSEIEVLGLRLNLHFIGSLYAASMANSFFPPWKFNEGTWYYSQHLGFYIDTSLLNIGLGWSHNTGDFLQDINLSVVLYGLGF